MQGLKENRGQFYLLVLVNAFVGSMVGLLLPRHRSPETIPENENASQAGAREALSVWEKTVA